MPTQRCLFLPWVSPSTPPLDFPPLYPTPPTSLPSSVVESLQQVGISEAKVRNKHSPVVAFQLYYINTIK